jgi:hypothetical protein
VCACVYVDEDLCAKFYHGLATIGDACISRRCDDGEDTTEMRLLDDGLQRGADPLLPSLELALARRKDRPSDSTEPAGPDPTETWSRSVFVSKRESEANMVVIRCLAATTSGDL